MNELLTVKTEIILSKQLSSFLHNLCGQYQQYTELKYLYHKT